MACAKILSLNELVSGETPLLDAVYAPNVNKIFGTSGPYLIKFNATTGARESFVRIAVPMYGDNRVCYHAGTGMLFVGGHNQINTIFTPSFLTPCRDVFQVNPTTLAVTPLNVGSWVTNWHLGGAGGGSVLGPQWVAALGDYIYFQQELHSCEFTWARVKANDFTTHNMGASQTGSGIANTFYWSEQFALDGSYVYMSDQKYAQIIRDTIAGPHDTDLDITGYPVVGMCFGGTPSLLYCVSGNKDLLRVDDFAGAATTPFDMSLLTVPVPPVLPDPVRIKLLSDGFLYMPCMGANGIIVWNTVSNTGIFKSGFVNPVDVIETPAKKWAVQNSAVGLKEIV